MHKNNFDFLRLLFALFVVISHSYALTGLGEADMLYQFTGGELNLGALGVKGFFIISGYLIYGSFQRSDDWFGFMAKRVLRIFPALVVLIVLTSLAGILVTDLTFSDYWHTGAFYSYIVDNLAIGFRDQKYLPGVFEANPNNFVNSSLWTIPYEWLMYCFLAGLFIFKKLPVLLRPATICIYLFFVISRYRLGGAEQLFIPGTVFTLNAVLNFGILFFSGCLLYTIKISRSKYNMYLLVASAIACVVLALVGRYAYMQYFGLPVVVVLFGSLSTRGLSEVRRIGDLSYGVYLYGFPVQQLLVAWFDLGTYQLMMVCVPLVLSVAWVSWHFLEKRALKYKGITLRAKTERAGFEEVDDTPEPVAVTISKW